MIKAGQPVFFGCDVGKFSDTAAGIMDTALFEYEVNIWQPHIIQALNKKTLECI